MLCQEQFCIRRHTKLLLAQSPGRAWARPGGLVHDMGARSQGDGRREGELPSPSPLITHIVWVCVDWRVDRSASVRFTRQCSDLSVFSPATSLRRLSAYWISLKNLLEYDNRNSLLEYYGDVSMSQVLLQHDTRIRYN